MRRATALHLISLASLLSIAACSEEVVKPGTTGTGGAGGSDGSGGAGGTGGSSTSVGPSSSSAAASSSTGSMPGYCILDEDCAGTPATPHCDDTLTCVGCVPGSLKCGPGTYCDPIESACKLGCNHDTQCDQKLCDPVKHACVECLADFDCPPGEVCSGSICVPGCSETQGCPGEQVCCGGSCHDLSSEIEHCGFCDNKCFVPEHAVAVCVNYDCGMGACDPTYANCDQNQQNGCEHNVLMDGLCACLPGATLPCYQGATGTLGVGPCKAGTRTCSADGTSYGACLGQVLPVAEICGNSVDEDCSGIADDVADQDGDGWTRCNGDCCDAPGDGCLDPKKVNPGAFEMPDNGVDDDCDPTTIEGALVDCGGGSELFAGVTGIEVAKAMDICQFTTASAPLAQRRWGLLAVTQRLPDGSAPAAVDLDAMQGYQTAILQGFGSGGIVPQAGATMAGLSTGRMRDAAHPGYVDPSPGTSFGRLGQAPAAFLAAHGGVLPGGTDCSAGLCPSGAGAHDGVSIRLSIRVPTNAPSFAYDFRFFSAEHVLRRCSPYNDFFLSLLSSSVFGIPADKNIAFDVMDNRLSSNSTTYQVCALQGCAACALGAGPLAGTGFDVGGLGAATAWLTAGAPVVPGETMQLELMVFDVSDDAGDTAVLLDNFRWAPKHIVGEDH